jgi:hypothetical protein
LGITTRVIAQNKDSPKDSMQMIKKISKYILGIALSYIVLLAGAHLVGFIHGMVDCM